MNLEQIIDLQEKVYSDDTEIRLNNIRMNFEDWMLFTSRNTNGLNEKILTEEQRKIINNEVEITYEEFMNFLREMDVSRNQTTLYDVKLGWTEYYNSNADTLKHSMENNQSDREYIERRMLPNVASAEDLAKYEKIDRTWTLIETRENPSTVWWNIVKLINLIDGNFKGKENFSSIDRLYRIIRESSNVVGESNIKSEEYVEAEKNLDEAYKRVAEKIKIANQCRDLPMIEQIEGLNLTEKIKGIYRDWVEKGKSVFGIMDLADSIKIDDEGNIIVVDEKKLKRWVTDSLIDYYYNEERALMVEAKNVFHKEGILIDESGKKEREQKEQYYDEQKLNIPYYQVATEVLMNRNEQSEEEVRKIIKTSSFEQVERQIGVKSSIDYAIETVSNSLSFTDENKEEFKKAVYEGSEIEKIGQIKTAIENSGANPNSIIMDTIFSVHDGWVKDNQKNFMESDERFQYMPSELIGWEKVKKHLLVIKPIFETAGIEIDEQSLEEEYNNRVKEFFLNNRIESTTDLINLISQGKDFYSALEGYDDETLGDIEDTEFIEEMVTQEIETNGIGKIEDVREGIIQQILLDPKEEELDRLSDEEIKKIEELIDERKQKIEDKIRVSKERTDAIERVKEKAKIYRRLQKEWADMQQEPGIEQPK